MALETPLIPNPNSESQWNNKFNIWQEVRTQGYISGPMLLVNVLQFLVQLTAVMFVGHLGKLPLASASLASSSCNVSGFIILMGMAAALETLCGQAYGAQQYRLLGIYLQRAVFCLLITSIPIAILWYNMGHVLLALGQDPTIVVYSAEYARFLIPGLFGSACAWPMIKYLQAQSAVVPMALCSLATLLVHIPLCWLFMYKFHVGGKGAALCVSISYWLNTIFLFAYIRLSKRCQKTFHGFSKEALRDFRGFFKLAIPATIMICLEAWSYELITLLAGLLSNPQLETSSNTSVMNTLVLFYMIPLSLSAAASTRAANELGAGHPSTAKSAVRVTICMGAIDLAVVVTFILSVRKVIGYAYTNDKEVVDHVASIFQAAIFIIAGDPIQGVLTGVSRGCGWQGIGALANLLAFYIVGLPVAITLAFVYKFNGKGLWIGVACGNITQTVVLCLITFFTNWEKLAEKAQTRVSESLIQ